MGYSYFTDKKHAPDLQEMLSILGPFRPIWYALDAHLHEVYPVTQDIHYLYGQKYGWGLRCQIKKKLLTNLYPHPDQLTVQINLPEETVQQDLALALNLNLRKAIEQATPYPEGRWLFFSLNTAADLPSIYLFLAQRAEHLHLAPQK